jgi:hypothetical protein
MRRITAVLPFLGLAAVLILPPPAAAQSYADLDGGWLVSSWTSPDGETNDEPERGLYLFTATGQYAIMFVNTDEPRPDLPEEPTDAQMMDAWRSFTANAGRYRIQGDQLTYEAWVAKWPNYMNAWDTETGGNAIAVTMSMDDEGLLTLEWEDGEKVTLRRAPGSPGSEGG